MNQNRPYGFFSRRWQSRLLIALAVLVTLVAVFYLEEDWRGKRAWQQCKADLEAQGMMLDWNKFIPPRVPDDQNFFTVNTNFYLRFVKLNNDTQIAAANKLSWLHLNWSGSAPFPVLDSVKSNQPVVAELMTVSFGGATNDITINLNDSAARAKIQNLIQKKLGRVVDGAQGFQFCEFQMDHLSPVKIVLQSGTPPSINDLKNLIPSNWTKNFGKLEVFPTADQNMFQVKLISGRITPAMDYLQWSDRFVPAFDDVRTALKRPYAVIPGDYSQPYSIPIPNFVTLRSLAQTLAQRADCYLLLHQPEKALQELTLMHNVCRILKKPPTGQPETLVEAMINVAISGLYANTIADGLRWHAWQEPQLVALQEQLDQIELSKVVDRAFNCEPAATTHTLETISTFRLYEWFSTQWKWALIPQIKSALIPRGWIYQNMTTSAQLVSQQRNGCDLADDLIQPRKFGDLSHELDAIAAPYKFIALLAIPNSVKAWQTTAYNQTLANEVQIACALERFRLSHGNYPESLDVLPSQFIEKLPHDIIGGRLLHYHRTGDGKFILYSIGWNETDDGGQVSEDRTKGDWVWKN